MSVGNAPAAGKAKLLDRVRAVAGCVDDGDLLMEGIPAFHRLPSPA